MPKDGPDLVAEAVAKAKAEWCIGQTPQEFSPSDYDAQTEWAQKYISANMGQWQKACG